ncbi:MAG: hypothetical protein R2748_05450 [Bryobacterales bacterium]
MRAQKTEEFRRFANPYTAAERAGRRGDHAVPNEAKGDSGAAMLENKTDTNPRKKHRNIPL